MSITSTSRCPFLAEVLRGIRDKLFKALGIKGFYSIAAALLHRSGLDSLKDLLQARAMLSLVHMSYLQAGFLGPSAGQLSRPTRKVRSYAAGYHRKSDLPLHGLMSC